MKSFYKKFSLLIIKHFKNKPKSYFKIPLTAILSHHEFTETDWPAHQTALTKHKRTRRATVMKYLHGWLATKSHRHNDGAPIENRCPLCCSSETSTNIFY